MRIITGLIALLFCTASFAQKTDSTAKPKPAPKPGYGKLDLKNRANDHFIIQFGYDNWAGKPDSIKITGFGRHFNMYAMFDMPFKTDPRWSAAIGAGVGSSNIYFDKTIVHLAANSRNQQVVFDNVADTTQYKKFKQTNVWLEAPVELRFVADPFNTNKSFKVAIGAKVGTLVSGYTKGKDFQTSSGQSIYSSKYILKEKDKSFFNSTRLAATLRVGYGPFGIYGAYQVLNLYQDGSGPSVRPYSIGLTISGL